MRIVIGEDQALFRNALVRLLVDAGHDVVGAAEDGPELLRRAQAEQPELVIADVRMPPTQRDEGLRAARRIRAAAPDTAVLVISHHLQVRYAVELLAGGARGVGYLLKQRMADVERFLAALETIRGGGTVIDAEVVAAMLGRLRTTAVSAGERELLGWIADDCTDASIAAALMVPEAEAARRVTAALAALGASTADATARAR
jgi:DNA-binding NarL/FixJ family response regulator